jgi:MoaA/NifB/PqqE/SkfB family radical SAM enzyme
MRPRAEEKQPLPALNNFGRSLVPAVCDVSVTNVCNATCDFCSFAHNKGLVHDRRWIEPEAFGRALPILHRRGIRYINFQGGEPLLHPAIDGLVAHARACGMKPAVITNGWLLPEKIERLAEVGLGTVLVSIDSHSMALHERNRGLRGLGERIRAGLTKARRLGIPAVASVTPNRLAKYEALPAILTDLGFDAVTFSYPRQKPFGSSSLVYSEDSKLVDFSESELVDVLEQIKVLKRRFTVLNPTISITDIQRHVQSKEELFACVGGHKYFYLDWNLDIWRCEAWSVPFGSVFDFDTVEDQRDRCTACIMSCYRDTSVMMHAGIAATDAVTSLRRGRLREAAGLLFRRTVALSLWSVLSEARVITRLARQSRRR